jgi:Icc-related predicted phosphoesterase
MRALVLADRPFHADPAALVEAHDVDVVLCLGDLQPSWMECLDRVRRPKLGVRGNHDAEPYMEQFGVEDLHLRRVELDGGPSVCGFEGCVDYRRGGGDGGPTYTQHRAAKLVRKLPPADVVICHCPPYGVNDDPDDPAHVGFVGLREWVLEHRPRLLLHGHTHPHPGRLAERLGATRILYVNGARIVELPGGPAAQAASRPARSAAVAAASSGRPRR